MSKVVLAAAAVTILSACGPTDEQRARVRAALPPGCQIVDLGTYGNIESMVALICDGRQTTSLNVEDGHGKTSDRYSVFEAGPAR